MKYKFLNAYEPVVNTCPGDDYFISNINTQVINQSVNEFATTDMGTTFVGDQYDTNYLSKVGWESINETNTGYRIFFSKENMDRISQVVSAKLLKAGHRMVVTPRVIGGVMSDVINTYQPVIGDMYTIYNIPNKPRNDVERLNEMVVNVIVSTIINEEDVRKWNESLSVWDTVYGDFNRKGLRAHPVLRTKQNDILKGQFNLNY